MKKREEGRDLFGSSDDVKAGIEADIQRLLKAPPAFTRARSSHPETSKLAAGDVAGDLPRLHREVLHLVQAHPRRTASELAAISEERDVRRVGRRLSELVDLGKLRRCAPRTCDITGRTAITWEVAE